MAKKRTTGKGTARKPAATPRREAARSRTKPVRSRKKAAQAGKKPARPRKKVLAPIGTYPNVPDWIKNRPCPHKAKYLSGPPILPKGITGKRGPAELVDETFLAYNAGRLREACRLLVEKILEPDVTVGMSLAGALTPAGLGCSCIVPLINAGFVDWIVSTGANLYHDLHFAFNLPPHVGTPHADDTQLQYNNVVRIYDVLLDYTNCLLETDAILLEILTQDEFQRQMGSARLHYQLGRYADQHERKNGLKNVSVLAAAYRAEVPIYTSSPGDSAIGMNVASLEMRGSAVTKLDPSLDVNETAGIVWEAKRSGGKSAVLLMGGGSPKNFILQTEPYIQEILKVPDVGHDYFCQVTDARADTGGLSGATPSEAVSWGKVDPNKLPDAVVCYTDTTLALPIMTHYALARHAKRPLKRLYQRRGESLEVLKKEHWKHNP